MNGKDRHTYEEKLAYASKLRKEATREERIVWKALKGKQLGYKYRRQALVGGFIADFYCPKARLVIELDGQPHAINPGKDEFRTRMLEKLGIRVIRFWNWEVRLMLGQVVQWILEATAAAVEDRARSKRDTGELRLGNRARRPVGHRLGSQGNPKRVRVQRVAVQSGAD
jgi:very-short-patch-repair endonuclease